MVPWHEYNTGKLISEISDMPPDVIGFTYFITYPDDIYYVGKKILFSIKTMKALKSGKIRPGTIRQVKRRKNKQLYDIVKVESNWKVYNGSHQENKTLIPVKREILQYAYSKVQLSYLETKWLFHFNVLERDDFINGNILGKFYNGIMANKTPELELSSDDLGD